MAIGKSQRINCIQAKLIPASNYPTAEFALSTSLAYGQLTCPICSSLLTKKNIDPVAIPLFTLVQGVQKKIDTYLCCSCSINNWLYEIAGSRNQLFDNPLSGLFSYQNRGTNT